jgi:uncharacterized protein
MDARREIKIIITGPMGAGKTTAVAAVSDQAPIKTEASNSDLLQHSKSHTTVGLDYGEVALAGGDRLRLYGTPGQSRFNFMWQILSRGALGVVILLDMTRPDPVQDLADYVGDFLPLIRASAAVVGVGRCDPACVNLDLFENKLNAMALNSPVFAVDVRQREDVLLLLEALFSQIEMANMPLVGE